MNIVLSGYYGFDNVGDEAILFAIIRALREWDPAVEITVLSNNPAYTAETYGVNAVNRWKPGEVRAALKQSDGLISGGGSLLQDKTGPKSIPYYLGVIKLAQWMKKPVFVYAQGMGPVSGKANRLLMKKVLQKAELLTVRDSQSKQLLEDIGITRSITVVPDPVMGLNPGDFQSNWLEKDPGIQTIAVSVRDWTENLDYLNDIAASLDELAERGNRIVFVPMHGEHDLKTSERTAAMMQQEALIAPHDSSIEEKMAIISEVDLLIGMRLHALIFAAAGSTPFLALSYDPKIDSFASITGQRVIGSVSPQDWNHKDLTAAAERILKNYAIEAEKLNEKALPLQKQAAGTANLVLDALRK
ncbi:polysaccharide pyruvyl transferase CsaB [Planococcus lenghuensis]|uniref:Polysaccharide pyruvyl transferase CsaB n=1 Tax=Planococcus lenghuensis TaxID=2213202 RepID=A0A1Q2L1F0_9BACL|nr:polysaccharide pyruvyl transferase CsaB [Planococcus lenghuensis]AQQ54243.1 polysaccharide pyruvyl transferase CsaB [Planococcus lenghuensis]